MTNSVRTTFDNFAKGKGFTKRSGAWYLARETTILVLELQKSNYGQQYFVNVALWFLALGDSQSPKERTCHLRTRLTQVVPDPEQLTRLLDVEWMAQHAGSEGEFCLTLKTSLGWVIDATASLEALQSEAGQLLVSRSLVTGPAQELLAEAR